MWIPAQAVLTGATVVVLALTPERPTFPGSSAVTIGLIVLGLVLAGLGRLHLGSSFQVHPTPLPDAPLVTHGIYRILRHPIYTALLSILIGATVERLSWGSGLAMVANLVFYARKARFEEDQLEAVHPAYAAYRQRTFGVIPIRKG